MFGFVFLCFPESSFQKTSTHVCAELKGKEFVQTIRKAELEDAGAMGGVWRGCALLRLLGAGTGRLGRQRLRHEKGTMWR